LIHYYFLMVTRRGRPPHNDLLTPAEWRTVNFVRHGLTNQQIANRCGVSLDAVKYHVANAIVKLGVSNRKALKTWVGSPRDSALRVEDNRMDEDTKYYGIGQVSRSTADIKAAEAWYREVLGLEHLYTFGDLAFFECGGTRLMLSQAGEKLGDESLIYLHVPDINASHEHLIAKGVEFITAPHMVHKHDNGEEEWMAFFKDPDGRPLAIMSKVGPAES